MTRLNKFLTDYPQIHHNLSIDTYKPKVAKLALENGFNMINDICGGGEDGQMFEIAQSFNSKIVIMHMKGNPTTMQNNPNYKNIIDEILYYFERQIKLAIKIGLEKSQIILDPGIGFGKRLLDNDIIINNIDKFKQFELPVMIGISRKSFFKMVSKLSRIINSSCPIPTSVFFFIFVKPWWYPPEKP